MRLRVGARELRVRAAEVLRAVRDGEEVTLTYRGRPIATVIPIRQRRKTTSAEDVFGMWRERDDLSEVLGWVRDGRRRRLSRLPSTRTS
ncbi:MAG: type II toxin-antitoxin system Phd/YefM family antitoxin [Actinomycetota bacterium]